MCRGNNLKLEISMWDQDLYLKALRFAAEAHGDQKVPGSDISYLYHVACVVSEVSSVLFKEEVNDPNLLIQCALLHDVVEDTKTSIDEVGSLFGEKTAAGVEALSKSKDLPKGDAMKESLARIKAQPREIWMVKLADRITNLQPPPADWNRDKCTGYRKEALYILESLGEASLFLSERLASKCESYRQYCL